MVSPRSPKQNHLLAALQTHEYERLAPHLELVQMPLGEALYESRHHSVDQPLCRWLLLSLDRLTSNQLNMAEATEPLVA